MINDYSTEALLQFLDYLSNKGLMNKKTVQARKASCNKMLSILDESESSDLRQVNIDDIANRFGNLEGSKYKPNSLLVYKSRLTKALDDFMRYKDNPSTFVTGADSKRTKTKKPDKITTEIKPIDSFTDNVKTGQGTFNIPIPLRTGCIIQLNGVPTDLTASEANKIAKVVVALATEDEA